jgi:alpha-acetolactate decarboxylase
LLGAIALAISVLALIAWGFAGARPTKLPQSAVPVPLEGASGSIRTYGSIPELFEGKTGAKVSLRALSLGPRTLAIGSLSELRGEVVVLRGQPWISYPAPRNGIKVERGPTLDETVAFLALTEVPQWTEQALENAIAFEHLASELEQRASKAGIDVRRPVPVMIDGSFSSIELNVANGLALGSRKPTPKSLQETAIKASVPQAKGTLVGFFARQGGERLVHEGKLFHLHVVLPELHQVGHLDSAQIEPGSVLWLPAL